MSAVHVQPRIGTLVNVCIKDGDPLLGVRSGEIRSGKIREILDNGRFVVEVVGLGGVERARVVCWLEPDGTVLGRFEENES